MFFIPVCYRIDSKCPLYRLDSSQVHLFGGINFIIIIIITIIIMSIIIFPHLSSLIIANSLIIIYHHLSSFIMIYFKPRSQPLLRSFPSLGLPPTHQASEAASASRQEVQRQVDAVQKAGLVPRATLWLVAWGKLHEVESTGQAPWGIYRFSTCFNSFRSKVCHRNSQMPRPTWAGVEPGDADGRLMSFASHRPSGCWCFLDVFDIFLFSMALGYPIGRVLMSQRQLSKAKPYLGWFDWPRSLTQWYSWDRPVTLKRWTPWISWKQPLSCTGARRSLELIGCRMKMGWCSAIMYCGGDITIRS